MGFYAAIRPPICQAPNSIYSALFSEGRTKASLAGLDPSADGLAQPCSSTSARSNGTTSFSTASTSSIAPGSAKERVLMLYFNTNVGATLASQGWAEQAGNRLHGAAHTGEGITDRNQPAALTLHTLFSHAWLILPCSSETRKTQGHLHRRLLLRRHLSQRHHRQGREDAGAGVHFQGHGTEQPRPQLNIAANTGNPSDHEGRTYRCRETPGR